MHPRFLARSFVAVALGLALALGLAVSSCGPKEKFCPDAGDGVCPIPIDAPVVDMGMEAPPMEMGSIFVGADAGTD
jgi:hypothetical protein